MDFYHTFFLHTQRKVAMICGNMLRETLELWVTLERSSHAWHSISCLISIASLSLSFVSLPLFLIVAFASLLYPDAPCLPSSLFVPFSVSSHTSFVLKNLWRMTKRGVLISGRVKYEKKSMIWNP